MMQFALVNGTRHPATPKLVGACAVCGSQMISKCGTKVLWHWAHQGRKHCDPWWENETEWHRSWKGYFPEPWREQVHFDASGEKHIADVKTPSGTVLEFQNSPMPLDELQAREQFYGNMLWIVNGLPFIDHFYILSRLPSNVATWTKDIVFSSPQGNMHGRSFWRRSENPDYQPGRLVWTHSMDEIQKEIDEAYIGQHLFDWVRPRSVWLDSQVPVYIDFGGDLIWQMQRYDQSGLRCVQAVRKMALIKLHGGEYTDTGKIVQAARRPTRSGSISDKGETEVLLNAIQ